MVLFTSPVQHYVTPKFYTATKPATGKVAPTWNYAAVQVYGRLRVAAGPPPLDPQEGQRHTSETGSLPIEVEIDRIEGKFKVGTENGQAFETIGATDSEHYIKLLEQHGVEPEDRPVEECGIPRQRRVQEEDGLPANHRPEYVVIGRAARVLVEAWLHEGRELLRRRESAQEIVRRIIRQRRRAGGSRAAERRFVGRAQAGHICRNWS